MTHDATHPCSDYSCMQPACIAAQRDELRDRIEDAPIYDVKDSITRNFGIIYGPCELIGKRVRLLVEDEI